MGVKVREKPKGSGIYWIVIDHQSCTMCHKCVWICPVEALFAEMEK